jgi:hypothetical protein
VNKKNIRKSGKAFTFPSADGLLSGIFLFFIERAEAPVLSKVEASSGLSFFVTFLDKQKSLKENNIRFWRLSRIRHMADAGDKQKNRPKGARRSQMNNS